jgi:hypothetical protein
MLRETILQLSKAAEARKPALLVKIAELTLTMPSTAGGASSLPNPYKPQPGPTLPSFTPQASRPFDSAAIAFPNVDLSPIPANVLTASPEDVKGTTLFGGLVTSKDKKPDSYLPAIGYGAGAGALAGIPIALLARALFSQDEEDSDLRSYLMTALKGALIGGGVGGLAGAGLRGAYGTEGGKNTIDKGLGYLPDSARTSAQNVLG